MGYSIQAKVHDKNTCFQLSRLIYPLKVNKQDLVSNLPDDAFDEWLEVKTVDTSGFQLYSPDKEYVWCVPFRFIASLRKV